MVIRAAIPTEPVKPLANTEPEKSKVKPFEELFEMTPSVRCKYYKTLDPIVSKKLQHEVRSHARKKTWATASPELHAKMTEQLVRIRHPEKKAKGESTNEVKEEGGT